MQLIYNVKDKPSIGKILTFAFQQMIAIMAATLLVPIIVSMTGLSMDPAAALFGAGIGTVVYLLCTKKESPVFLGSSFTFIGALSAAAAQNYGYWGIIIGIAIAGVVYIIISAVIKVVGSDFVNKILPPVIIGPILTLIGLSLSSTATGWMSTNGGAQYNMIAILIGLFTFFAIVVTSVKGGKSLKLIPFIVGIGSGYGLALVVTLLGMAMNVQQMQVLSFAPFVETFGAFSFQSIIHVPEFTFLRAIETSGQYTLDGAAIGNLALLFAPIAIVELAQHIADHKNISNIIEKDLIKNPGLDRTLLGDGLGSMIGGFFGGCANTTYGESIGCVAITKNASTITIMAAGIGCMVLSFFTPFVVVINSIPKCVMGGACIAMYGFIAVSGLQMLRNVDLGDSRNLYVVAVILVCGIGGLAFNFGVNELSGSALFSLTPLATALVAGLVTNAITHSGKDQEKEEDIASAQVDISKEAFGSDTTTSKFNS